jgi:hypothetical protein
MAAHRDIRGLAVARRVLDNPQSTNRALRAALADCLRILATMRAQWMAETSADRDAMRLMAQMLAGQSAVHRPPSPGKPRLHVVGEGK